MSVKIAEAISEYAHQTPCCHCMAEAISNFTHQTSCCHCEAVAKRVHIMV
ncbi:MAG: hypothetical protein AB4063_11715 [Crocosphaera sp.]